VATNLRAYESTNKETLLTDSIEEIIARARREGRLYLLEHECKAILKNIGVPTTSCLVARSEEEAVSMSEAIGYPVALKILSPDIIHKSDTGGVKLNLGRGEVRGAYSDLVARFKDRHVIGVSIQEMAKPGLEVIVGMTKDATFGPVLMFGLGGVFVEALKDVAFRVIPVTEGDAQEMMEEIRGYQLLRGYRGQSADVASLRDILLKVSGLVMAHPAIKEVDLNPVFAYPKGSLVVDARMILEDDPPPQVSATPRADLTAVFEPQSVAIVGASTTPGKTGSNILDNLLRLGYAGEIYPVNPKADEILGVKAYPAVDQIPHPVDLAIIATPAKVVVDVMRDCARKGIKAAIIISSGFAEEGQEGRQLQDEVMTISRRAGIRVLGPNTTGILNGENRFTSSFLPIPVDKPFNKLRAGLRSGNVAFIAQTGLFLGVLFEHIISSQHFGISKVVGLGNKADVDDADILEYLAGDAQTEVIAMYIEGLRDGRRLLRVAQEVAREKPVVVLKSGTTESGAEAALSHTASLAGKAEVFDAACKQAGISRVHSFEELLNVVKAFSFLPIPMGNRVAVIHYTGAACVLAADACQKEGLELAEFSPATVEALRKITPTWHRIRNPIDLWPAIERVWLETAYGVAIEALLRDQGVDALVISLFAMPRFETYTPDFDLLRASGKPVLFCVEGNEDLVRVVAARIEGQGFPVYSEVSRAIFALSHLSQRPRFAQPDRT
jgi:acyl-CoA synthetase (NDP forming)